MGFQGLDADAKRQGVLAVQGIDFCVDTNGENHHTNKFNLMTRDVDRCLVVRRGQAFKLDILLNRPYDASRDAVSFNFYVADVETRGPSDETSAAVPLLEKGSETFGGWSATYEGQVDSHLMVAVTPPADCIVAAWKLDVDTRLSGGSSLSYRHPLPIYVLFNPWCLTDTVYMAGHSHRDEYVLEEGGLMFAAGSYTQIETLSWNYAQYDKDVLDCALYLVTEIGKVKGRARSDPIRTCRALSAAVNAPDDNGVIVGNWDTEVSDDSGATSPVDWVGSLAILQKYYKEKASVKYGQCWVYAGVLTTICRALGIPCRPVTAFEAAHDTQGSLTIDIIKDDQGNDVNTSDSIWNFHVWNEVWMERPDLGPEYGGWQVIDSTPQETSEGKYRCGPASLRAVKEGELERPYDTAYFFAEVNADKVTWKYSRKNQSLTLMSYNPVCVGQHISTKTLGKMEREDITNTYKYPEGTREERMTMKKALRKSESIFARYHLNKAFNVTLNFDLQDDIKIGQNFNVVLHIRNSSSTESHQVKCVLRVNTVTDTGLTGEVVKKEEFDLNMEPEGEEVIKMTITFDDYYNYVKLVDQDSFEITCLATIVDTKFEITAEEDFRVRNPDIKISIDGKPVSHQEFTVSIKVENPLPIPLTKGKFCIKGAGLEEQLEIQLNESVAPGEFATAQCQLTPPRAGRHQISVKFTCKEMRDVDRFLTFMVEPPAATNGVPPESI